MNWKSIKQAQVSKIKEMKLGDKSLGDYEISDLKLRCRMGLHKWEEWKFVDDHSCQQIRSCKHPKCDETQTQDAHMFPEWEFVHKESCRQIRICVRCSDEDSQMVHSWEKIYESPTSCKQFIGCKKCGQHKPGIMASLASGTNHEWGKWEYEADTSCTQFRVCERCGEREKKQLSHEWGEWQRLMPNECKFIRVCKRCRQRDNERIYHAYGEWIRTSPKSCEYIKTCSTCGSQERKIIHEWKTVQRDIDTKELAFRQFLNMTIQNGCPREKITVFEVRYKQTNESMVFGDSEQTRHEFNKLIHDLEKLAREFKVPESFARLMIETRIVEDNHGNYYLYDEGDGSYAQAYCGQCGMLSFAKGDG